MLTPCCGNSLRTGTIIVASMEIIFASVSAIFYILGLAAVGSSADSRAIRAIQVNFRIPFLDVETAQDEQLVGALTGIFVVALLSCIVVIAFSTFLLLSLHRKGNENHVKVWLHYKALMLILAVGYILSVTVSGYSTWPSGISDALSTAMHLYFFWVVFGFWKELEKERKRLAEPSITQIQGNIELSFPL